MKKIILLCFVLFAFSVVVNAQLIKSISVSGGYANGMATLNYNEEMYRNNYRTLEHTKPLNTWGVEAGITFWKSKYFSFSTQIGYLQKASVVTPYVDVFDDCRNISRALCDRFIIPTINYYNNVVFFAPRISVQYPFKKYNPYIFITPRADYIISNRLVSRYNNNDHITNQKEVHNQKANPLIGGVYGLGISRKISNRFSAGVELSNFLDFQSTIKKQDSHKLTFNTYTAYLTLQYSLVN